MWTSMLLSYMGNRRSRQIVRNANIQLLFKKSRQLSIIVTSFIVFSHLLHPRLLRLSVGLPWRFLPEIFNQLSTSRFWLLFFSFFLSLFLDIGELLSRFKIIIV